MKTPNISFPTILSSNQLLAILCSLILLSSCVTNKKTTYLQEYDQGVNQLETVTPETYRIQPNDNLFIRVTTPDPRWSEMFNTLPVSASTMSVTEQSVDILSYPVQLDGTVDIPYLGSIVVAGKTIPEAKVDLEDALTGYISDAAITVKLVNNYVSILGEVNRPGLYPIFKEQLTIFQAISMAGDLAVYSNRYNVNIVRKTSEGTITADLDLTDKGIIGTEFYYILPNDVIYVEPMKGKFFGMNNFPFALILTSVTTFVLVMNYID